MVLERTTVDDILMYIIENSATSLYKPNGSERIGFMLNVSYRDIIDTINGIIPEDNTKAVDVSRKMMIAVILTRHVSEPVKLKRVAFTLGVSSHALIVHYRKEHDKRIGSNKIDYLEYKRAFQVIIETLSYISTKNKQRIDNFLKGNMSS